MQDQSSDFTPIREKRIATEFAQIERREDLKQFKISDYTTDLGMIVHVSIQKIGWFNFSFAIGPSAINYG